MIDIETLGTRPGSVIASIGAVAFDFCGDEGLGPEFHERIDLDQPGLSMDPKTVAWWMQQSNEARREIHEGPRAPLGIGLANLSTWVDMQQPKHIWANDPDFDLVMLNEAYARRGMPSPLSFRKSRSMRTIKAFVGLNKNVAREGTHHNALGDAIHQARQLAGIGAGL